MINHRAGKGWLDYFRGIVGEIPLSGSEDYRNIFSSEITRTINSFLPPPQLIDFYTLRGYTLLMCGGRSCSAKKEKLHFFFPDWRISTEEDDIRQSENIETPFVPPPILKFSVLLPGTLAQPLLVVHSCSMISRERDELGE